MNWAKAEHRESKRVQEQQLTIWGRANSVNVQKVLWCLRELDLSYRRIDAGMAFGKNNEPEYLAMNPNGRVPTLVDGDYVLWESNSVMRYLCIAYGKGSPIYPSAPKARASRRPLAGLDAVDAAAGRSPGVLGAGAHAAGKARHGRDPEGCRRRSRAMADHRRAVATRRFIEGDQFTIADIALGAYARRWFGVEGITKPKLPNLERWFAEFSGRPGFVQFIAPPMS